MQLRKYQSEAISRMLWARKLDGNALISVPTGGGKSLIISEFAKELNEPILILVPSKELLQQDKDKLSHWTKVNVYSASMNEKTIGNITLATIQSAYKNPQLFTNFKVVIIDEAHLVNPKNLAGTYQKLFRGMGDPKIYGLTATPFRMDSYYKRWGYQKWMVESITTVKMLTRYREKFWSRMLYVKHADELIEEEYLVPLTYHTTKFLSQNDFKMNKSKSDFDLTDFETKFVPFLERTANLINGLDKQSLVFCATITQGTQLQTLVDNSAIVSSETPSKERAQIVDNFKNGTLKHVINVGILLTGFDKPDLENIVVARPTRSVLLWLQLLGRGMRPSEGKETCNVYDLVGNTEFLGTAESMKIQKIEEKWNVTTDAWEEGLHYAPLYKFKLRAPKDTVQNTSDEFGYSG